MDNRTFPHPSGVLFKEFILEPEKEFYPWQYVACVILPMVRIADLAIQGSRPLDKEQRLSYWAPGLWAGRICILSSYPRPFLLSPGSHHACRMPVTSFCANPSSPLSGFLYSFRESSCCQPAHSTILSCLREQLELSQGLILLLRVWYQIFPTSWKRRQIN